MTTPSSARPLAVAKGKRSAVALTAAGKNIELGKYHITRLLGQGGFGLTYLAQNLETGQDVVVKENLPTDFMFRDSHTLQVVPMSDELEADCRWAMDNFLHEARLLMKLSHPNIVKVQDAFAALGTAYYVMPWVGGNELGQAAPAPGEITEDWLAPILRQLLEALQYLHGKNILHRDIKPSNILMSEGGEPVLIDFGAARAIISEKSATKVGTPGYTPIEQVQSKGKRGPWTDFYALGATCYRLITGKRPPQCEDRMGKRDCYHTLAPQAELYSRFSQKFLEAIDKALSVWGEDRWQKAEEWLATLPAPKPAEPTPAPNAVPTTAAAPPNDNSSLTDAARKGDTKLVQLLLSAGADVNRADVNGNTPLYCATWEGHTEVVRLLLQAPGIDVNRADKYGWTPLYAATTYGHTEVIRLLLQAPGIDVDKTCQKRKWTRLHLASFVGYTDMVRQQLADGADVNKADKNGKTPLDMAAYYGHTEVVRLLLAAPGIDVDKTCQRRKWTRLHLAASAGLTDVIGQELNAGADVNKEDKDGNTPLDIAKTDEIRNLLRSAKGKSKIERAESRKWTHIKLIIAASLLIIFSGGLYVYHTPRLQTLITLLFHGVDIINYERRLNSAAREGDAKLVQLLLSAGADVNRADGYGYTPLYCATWEGHTEVVKLLLAAPGIDVNESSWGETPLHQAAEKGHTEVVKLLLAAPGIFVNATSLSRSGPSPYEPIPLSFGIPINQDRYTPLDKARTKEIERLLREAGGKTGVELGVRQELQVPPYIIR